MAPPRHFWAASVGSPGGSSSSHSGYSNEPGPHSGVNSTCPSGRGMLAVQAAVDTKVAAAVEEINLAR